MASGLLAMAKEHFGYLQTAPDCNIPKPYLKELQDHISQYPWDTNFAIKRQPRQGFGTLTCLEMGCQISMALTRLEDQRDGGKKGGVGSLSLFRDHVETHPTHKKACLRRVKANEDSSETENLAVAMNARVSNAVASRAVDAPNRRASAHYAMELTVPTLPRKRHSDSAFAEPLMKDESPSSPKKARQEAVTESKSPLANNSVMVNQGPVSDDEFQEELRDLIAKITRQEQICGRGRRKKCKTRSDLTRLRTAKKQLSSLTRRRDELKAQLSNNGIPLVKADPILRIGSDEPTKGVVAGPSGSVQLPLTANSNPQLKSETEPELTQCSPSMLEAKFSTFKTIVKQENLAETFGLVALSSETEALTVRLNISPSSLQSVKKEYAPVASTSNAPAMLPSHLQLTNGYASVASTSNAHLPVARPADTREPGSSSSNNVVPQPLSAEGESAQVPSTSKAVAVNEPPPVASSSKTQIQPFPFRPEDYDMGGPSEDDDSEDEDEYGMVFNPDAGAPLAKELVKKAGMRVPGPVRETNHFYDQGPNTYAGPQAKADDINHFLVMAGNSEQFDSNASVAQALDKLGLRTQYDLMPGMEVALMAHQVIGVAWMVDREAAIYKGGCLADDMGLGKTVQMIAVLVKNRPTGVKKTNLILAPLALLDQWKCEIETKTNCGLKVLIYHGPSRPRRKSDLEQYDVVLTTYSTMAMEWPDYERQATRKAKARRQNQDFIASDSDEDLITKVGKRKEKAGLLFQMEFYRIILDESQQIRNRRTRASRAANELASTYRWCLTGTPIINALMDCYGYIRFLKIRPWYDWDDFNLHIASKEKKNPSLAVSRLQAILSTFQLRRTKESKLDGKKLIELPDKKVTLTALKFSTEESDIYKMIEAKSQEKFNRFLKAGTVLKNYHQVLVLLLRLRQLCSHPCLIQEDAGAFVAPEDVDHSKAEVASELSRAAELVSPEFVNEMKRRLKERMLNRMEAEKQSADAALEDEDCPVCLDVMDASAIVTACKHSFCRECIIDVLENPAYEHENDVIHRAKDERPCPVCRASISRRMIFTRSAFEPTEKDLNPNATTNETEDRVESSNDDMDVDEAPDEVPVSRKGKGRAVARRRFNADSDDDEDDDGMSDFIVEDDEDEEEKNERRALRLKRNGKRRANVILDSDEEDDEPEVHEVIIGRKSRKQLESEVMKKMPRFLPSTKMKYMMEIIVKSFEERPEEKILVVSQWTSCLSLVSDYLSEKGIGHVKYQGDMSRDKRDQAVRVFMSKDKAKIMLMSLKCGGVGLNLTRANNVISLDLAWSRAVESQAWDRLHRLGQTRAVDVQRLVIADTVENRILALQERKQLLADGSLGEGKGKKIGKLTVRELANLFGLDHYGRALAH